MIDAHTLDATPRHATPRHAGARYADLDRAAPHLLIELAHEAHQLLPAFPVSIALGVPRLVQCSTETMKA